MKFIMEKNRYVAIISGKGRKRVFLYNKSKPEILTDAFWAFSFGNASEIKIYSCRKERKLLKVFSSVQEWKTYWQEQYGNANYFVWHNRY